MPHLHVATVGAGKEVAESILFAIDKIPKPDYVLLLATPDTRDQAESIKKSYDMPVRVEICGNLANVDAIAKEYRKVIKEAMAEWNIEPKNVSINFTRGTKAMSAAIVYVAIELGVNQMMYVEGQERDRVTKNVTECTVLTQFELREISFHRNLERLLFYFNKHRFKEGLEFIKENLEQESNSRRKKILERLQLLFSSYQYWDAFQINEAKDYFKKLGKELKPITCLDTLKRYAQSAIEVLEKMDSDAYCDQWVLTLYACAQRRYQEGLTDVAVALLYRLIEFMAHQKLYEKGYNPAKIDIEKLPSEIRPQWASMAENGNLKLGLRRSYELLRDLNDSLGESFLQEYENQSSKLRQGLDQRNSSVLAHGIQPISDSVYENLSSWITSELNKKFENNFDAYLKKHQFPELTQEIMDGLENAS